MSHLLRAAIARNLLLKLVSALLVVLTLLLSACGPVVISDPQDCLDAGWRKLEERDYEAARATFETLLNSDGLEPSIEGMALYGFALASSQAGEPQVAVEAFERLLESFPDQESLVPYALWYSAADYERLGRFDAAEAALLRMLEMAPEDGTPSGDTRLMGNPYSNQRHHASFGLAELYLRRGRHVLASAYLAASERAFPYIHFCGNAHATERFKTVLLKSKILEHEGKPAEAVDVLLPYVLKWDSNLGLEKELTLQAATLLGEQLTPEELDRFVEESLDSIELDESPFGHSATIRLAEHELRFFPPSCRVVRWEEESAVEDLRRCALETDFFRLLTGTAGRASTDPTLPDRAGGGSCDADLG